MRKRWAVKVKEECESVGFVFSKDNHYNRWQMLDGGKVLYEAKGLGDVLRMAGNALEIPVD